MNMFVPLTLTISSRLLVY